MEATSAAQFEAASRGGVPGLELVRSDVWALGMPMPVGNLPYSLVYLLRGGDGGLLVVDPGLDSDENWAVLTAALAEFGGADAVRTIVATHLHPDHLGMADRLRAASGARLLLHEAEQAALDAGRGRVAHPDGPAAQLDEWGVPEARRAELLELAIGAPMPRSDPADALLRDGDRVELAGFELRVVWTPGHTPGSICMREAERGILLTGDHVLPTLHPGLGLGGPTANNPLADYLASVERVSAFADEALPGHGYRFTGLAERAGASAAHQLRRAGEVAAALAEEPSASTWQLASRLSWTAGWQRMRGFLLLSALMQTDMHRDYVRASSRGSH